MALWHQIRRCGVQRLVIFYQNHSFLSAPMRSFAVPAHVKAKQEVELTGPRLNGDITAAYVRLVTDEGHGVVSRWEALDRAKKLNLDLVEVQRTAKPPVCKLVDFHKEKFKQELKEKERAKSKSTPTLRNGENKEVRFTAKTEPKDLKIKAETITRLMERGYRVKCTVLPLGKEVEDLRGLLPRLLTLINDVAIVESGPHVVDTKQAYIIVRHVKFSTKKSGKKAIKALDAVNQCTVLTETGTVNSSVHEEMMPHQVEEWEFTECGSETENEDLSDQDTNIRKPLHQKPLPSKSVPDSSRSEMDVNKEQTTLKSASAFVPLQSEPSVVEVNRYAKQSEPNRFQQNRERMPHQAARNEGDTRIQFDPKQRQFNNTSNPSSPSSGYGRGPAIGKPSNLSSSAPSFGNFGTSKPVSSRDQINLGVNGDKFRIHSPTFFSASKSVPSNEQNPKEGTVDQTRNPRSPAQSYGIFSSSKPVGSGDQSSINNTVDKPGNTSNPSSQVFSTTKPVGSGDQKSSKDATENKPGSTSSAQSSYGIFSKSKAGSAGA